MHKTRRFFFLTLLACMALSHPISATVRDNYQTNHANHAEERSCIIRPSWALGGLAVAALLVIALQQKGCRGNHYYDLKDYNSSGSHQIGSHHPRRGPR